ncbi:hypothetical protein HON36_04120 [Candidatus Parcubacteria bacterium]|jgi:hypothetical protein|nr:hypothetical protein [Candidatus Parcubacteria bacterium]
MYRDRHKIWGPEVAQVQRACQDFLDTNPSNEQLAEVVSKGSLWRDKVTVELLSRDPSDAHLRLIVEKVPEWRGKATKLLLARIKWNADCIVRNV